MKAKSGVQKSHVEKHFTASDTVRDIVIGMSDGLTVPFALAAGLSGTVASTDIILTAGIAEIAAGSIAMGLGGYLAARGDIEHYDSERRREESEVREKPEVEAEEVIQIFSEYGLARNESEIIVTALKRRPKDWVDFMMKFELGLERDSPRRAITSAITIASAYICGGLIPLAPYVFVDNPVRALISSVVVTLFALSVFGGGKGFFTGIGAWKSAVQTTSIGGMAAGAAFLIAKWIS